MPLSIPVPSTSPFPTRYKGLSHAPRKHTPTQRIQTLEKDTDRRKGYLLRSTIAIRKLSLLYYVSSLEHGNQFHAVIFLRNVFYITEDPYFMSLMILAICLGGRMEKY
jgi:hypothetical protein